MVWLLILLCLAVVISPLLWMKNSPRQQSIQRFRDIARKNALKVSLQRRPEARDAENRLDAVCYWHPWGADIKPKHWVLHRYSKRGWPSPWQNWNWFEAEASAEWCVCIADIIDALPENVSAIVVNSSGVGMFWDEKGEDSTIEKINLCLGSLIEKGKEIYA